MRRQTSFVIALALCGLSGTCFGQIYVEADFNDKTINAPIGTGGAAVGEPVSVSPYINAIVRNNPFGTPCLEIEDDGVPAGSARFEFIDSVEVTWSTLTINVHLWFEGLEYYTLYVREQGTAAETFATLKFLPSGNVDANDKNSNLGTIGTYEPGRAYTVSLVYDMPAGTYDVYLDGCLVVQDETHGVVGRGIGAVIVGMGNDADLDGRYFVDDINVFWNRRPLGICPGTCALEADFDDKTIDAPIGTGGAEVGEPASLSPFYEAIVRSGPFETPCLEFLDDSTAAHSAKFELLGRTEITTRTFTMNAELWFDTIDYYIVAVREQGSAAQAFLTLSFASTGVVQASDSGGLVDTIATYETGRVVPVSLVFDMEADTYDIYLDGCLVVEGEPHGIVGRGVGSFIFGLGNDPDFDGRMFVDNIAVCAGVHPIVQCCAADLDGNEDVGFSDLLVLLAAWGPCGWPCPEDLNGNGEVDFADILSLLGSWGSCPEPGACCLDNLSCIVVPEAECTAQGGVFQGVGTTCGPIQCFQECVAAEGSCYQSGSTPGCDDPYCCNLVCTIDSYCCETMWDLLCTQGAQQLCTP